MESVEKAKPRGKRLEGDGRLARMSGRVVLSLLLALTLVPALHVQQALGAQVTYYGYVYSRVVVGDDLFPLYEEDGVTKVTIDECVITKVEGAPERFVLPESIDLVSVEDGSVIKDVQPTVIDFKSPMDVRAIDLTHCPEIRALGVYGLSALETIDFAQGGSLQYVNGIDNCPLLASLDFSGCPNLESIRASGNESLKSINVLGCEKLTGLYVPGNALTELDVDSIAEGVVANEGYDSFDCRRNDISDSQALVDRFGSARVLPQGKESQTGEVTWAFMDDVERFAFVVDPSSTRGGGVRYEPSQQEKELFDNIPDAEKYAKSTFKATSSDSSIVEVSIGQSYDRDDGVFDMLFYSCKGAGTASVTLAYDYQNYHASKTFDIVVFAEENPVVSIELARESVSFEGVADCPLGDGFHEKKLEIGEDIGYVAIAEDPDRRPTDFSLSNVTEGDDAGLVSVGFGWSLPSYGDKTYKVFVHPCKAGSGSVEIAAKNGRGDVTARTSFDVSVRDLGEATFLPQAATFDSQSKSSDLFYGPSPLFKMNEAMEAIISAHGREAVVQSMTSSDESVVEVDQQRLTLGFKNPGEATVTLIDMAGSVYESNVTVVDWEAEAASKLRFSSGEKTVNVGDTVSLEEALNAEALELAQNHGSSMYFESSNGNILPCGWPNRIALAGGRAKGDAELRMYYRNRMTDQMVLCDTMLFHVVDGSTGGHVTAVEVMGASHEVEMGSALQLSATITPADADNAKELAWSSSDEGVAKVDASGKVTPVAPGNATITATVGSVSGAYEVSVVPRVVPATEVNIAGAAPALKVGDTCKLSATVSPADSTDKVAWASSDEGVLKVDQSGLVTAVGNGTAYVTATAGSVSAATDAIQVTTPVSGVSLDASSLELYVGADASKLTATVSPATASNQAVTWTSSDNAVATVDEDGNVAPVAPGSATVTATTVDGGYTASCQVTVGQHATGIALDKTTAAIKGAGFIELKATVAPDNATNKNVIWATDDEAVASVDGSGKVVSVGKGTAIITATTEDGNFSASCTVEVSNPITKVMLENSSFALGKGERASTTGILTGDLPGSTDGLESFEWKSSNESVATVERVTGLVGGITAVASGSATIELSVNADGATLKAACTVTVTNPIQSVTLSETSKTVTVGDVDSFQLNATVTPADGDGADVVSWSSSDETVATVAADGMVSVKKAGAADIMATSGGKSASCALTVSPATVQAEAGDSGFAVSVEVSDPQLAKELKEAQAGDGLNLVVQAVDQLVGPAKDAVSKLTAAGSTVAETFDIHFAKGNGEEIVLNGKDGKTLITVRVKMTSAMKALAPESLRVHFIGDDGAVDDKDTWVDGEYLCFTTEHFSTYAVTGKPPASGGGEASDSGKPDPKPLDTGGADTLAATGDAVAPAAAGALGLAALCALCLVVARRRTN